MKVDKHHHEVASPQHELGIIFGTLTEQADNILKYKYVVQQRRAGLRQDRDLHAEALLRATTARACTSTCRSGRAASRSSPATSTPTFRPRRCGSSAASSSTPRRSTPSPTRRTNSYKRLIPGFEAPVLLRLLGAQPLGLRPHSVDGEPEGQARRGPLPRSVGQPLPRLRGAADGRPRRHPQQDRSRLGRPTRTSTTCRRRNWPRSRPSAARLREALTTLETDHDFLLARRRLHQGPDRGLHRAEVARGLHAASTRPHPVEYQMYYSC